MERTSGLRRSEQERAMASQKTDGEASERSQLRSRTDEQCGNEQSRARTVLLKSRGCE